MTKKRSRTTEVVIVGGYHDGLSGDVNNICVEQRMIVLQDRTDADGTEWWHAYFWDGEEQDQHGRLVYRPKAGLEVTKDD